MSSRSSTDLRRNIALHLFLTPLAVIWLFPLWMMAVFSTMPDNGIFSPGIELLPHGNFVTISIICETPISCAPSVSISVA